MSDGRNRLRALLDTTLTAGAIATSSAGSRRRGRLGVVDAFALRPRPEEAAGPLRPPTRGAGSSCSREASPHRRRCAHSCTACGGRRATSRNHRINRRASARGPTMTPRRTERWAPPCLAWPTIRNYNARCVEMHHEGGQDLAVTLVTSAVLLMSVSYLTQCSAPPQPPSPTSKCRRRNTKAKTASDTKREREKAAGDAQVGARAR